MTTHIARDVDSATPVAPISIFASLRGFAATGVLASLLVLASGCASSTGDGGVPEEPSPATRDRVHAQRDDGASRADPEADGELRTIDEVCTAQPPSGDDWLGRLRDWTYRTVCGTTHGFDAFFGDSRYRNEVDTTSGLLGVAPRWSEDELLEVDIRFRAKYDLPSLERKWQAFAGRLTEDEYLRDTEESASVDRFLREEEYDFVLGLGHTPLRRDRDRFDIGVGATVNMSPQVYTKGRWRTFFAANDNNLARFRQTVFWRSRDGFGTTSNLDLEHTFSDRLLFRWGNTGTVSEVSDGLAWYSSWSLFHEIGRERAFLYRAWIKGATDRAVNTDEYGVQIRYRCRLHREWLYGELTTGMAWIRDEPWEPREASFGVGFAVEIQFGRFDPW